MGVPGLWDVSFRGLSNRTELRNLQLLRPAGQRRSLMHLAVIDGFQEN